MSLSLRVFNASPSPSRGWKVRTDPQPWVCACGQCYADGEDDRISVGGVGGHDGGGSLTVPSFAHAFTLPSPARRTLPDLV